MVGTLRALSNRHSAAATEVWLGKQGLTVHCVNIHPYVGWQALTGQAPRRETAGCIQKTGEAGHPPHPRVPSLLSRFHPSLPSLVPASRHRVLLWLLGFCRCCPLGVLAHLRHWT